MDAAARRSARQRRRKPQAPSAHCDGVALALLIVFAGRCFSISAQAWQYYRPGRALRASNAV